MLFSRCRRPPSRDSSGVRGGGSSRRRTPGRLRRCRIGRPATLPNEIGVFFFFFLKSQLPIVFRPAGTREIIFLFFPFPRRKSILFFSSQRFQPAVVTNSAALPSRPLFNRSVLLLRAVVYSTVRKAVCRVAKKKKRRKNRSCVISLVLRRKGGRSRHERELCIYRT